MPSFRRCRSLRRTQTKRYPENPGRFNSQTVEAIESVKPMGLRPRLRLEFLGGVRHRKPGRHSRSNIWHNLGISARRHLPVNPII